jgi:predicted metal-binding protein
MSKITDTSAATKTYPTGWSETILICKKCSKKLSGGFGDGGYDPLRKALREALKAAGRRGQVGLIEVPCFGICPKKAVTVAFGGAPGELLVVPVGFDARQVVDRTVRS